MKTSFVSSFIAASTIFACTQVANSFQIYCSIESADLISEAGTVNVPILNIGFQFTDNSAAKCNVVSQKCDTLPLVKIEQAVDYFYMSDTGRLLKVSPLSLTRTGQIYEVVVDSEDDVSRIIHRGKCTGKGTH